MSVRQVVRKAGPAAVLISFILMAAAWVWLTGGSFNVRAFRQQSSAMTGAVFPGDFFVTDLSHRSVIRGAVVVISCRGVDNLWCVTRVIGLPGDTVAVRGHHALVNGKPLDEPYVLIVASPETDSVANRKPVVVPPDHIWVLGDNRSESYDSRFWGFAPLSAVRGRPIAVYWSWERGGGVRWSRIGHRIR